MAISAATKVAGVIGDPVGHSLSPTLHNAAFASLGLDWVYVAFAVPAGRAAQVPDTMRLLGIIGLSVTMPHKQSVAKAADKRTVEAAASNAANTLTLGEDGTVTAHNTDGPGFLAGLRRELGFDVEGRRIAMIGAGGASRAVIDSVVRAGAAEVVVLNRSAERGKSAAAVAGGVGRVGRIEDLSNVDIVVNATPVGMAGRPGLPVPAGVVGSGQVAVDLVYRREPTAWLRVCAEHGALVLDGLPMLVHQAAEQVKVWTNCDAPIDAMTRAIAERLEPGSALRSDL